MILNEPVDVVEMPLTTEFHQSIANYVFPRNVLRNIAHAPG